MSDLLFSVVLAICILLWYKVYNFIAKYAQKNRCEALSYLYFRTVSWNFFSRCIIVKMDSWQKFMDDDDEEKKIITTVGRQIVRSYHNYLID